MYYAINNNITEELGDVCPSLITLDIISSNDVIMINSSVSVNINQLNITQPGILTLYIGQLPGKRINPVLCRQLFPLMM